MFIALTAIALAAASAPCNPVAGADRLWDANVRWIFVGEVHGTNETPDAFANLVCLAAQQGPPVTVALEYPADEQPVIDAFIASDGSERARAALLAMPIWHRDFQDGRSSVAFLRLFERLRAMKQRGLITGVRGFDVPEKTRDPRDRNAAMADRLSVIQGETKGRVMVLVGNFHAVRRTVEFGGKTIAPAASLLPRARTITVNVLGSGGMAWDCEQDGCGPHATGPERRAVRGITFETDPGARWDATYELGVKTSVAQPAIPTAAKRISPGQMKLIP